MSTVDAMVDVTVDTATDLDTVERVLTQAFADDPVMLWIQPDARRHRMIFHTLLRNVHGPTATLELAVRDGATIGAAAWDPPGHTISAKGQVMSSLWFIRALGPRIGRGIVLEQAFMKRRPKERHWYLGQLGAAAPGLGAGTALLEQRLSQIDAPAYLESSNERNLPLYERFGFRVTEEVVLPFDGPTVWLMYRPMP